jgi:hypothetical protein
MSIAMRQGQACYALSATIAARRHQRRRALPGSSTKIFDEKHEDISFPFWWSSVRKLTPSK